MDASEMDASEMDAILDELAAGRIDRAEAARRIESVRSADQSTPDPGSEAGPDAGTDSPASSGPLGWPSSDPSASPTATDLGGPDEQVQAGSPQSEQAEESGTPAESLDEQALGRSQSPGVTREDFSRPVHEPTEDSAATEPGEQSDAKASTTADAGTGDARTGDSTDAGTSSQNPTAGSPRTGQQAPGADSPDLASWLGTARRGFGRLRSDAEKGFDRLRQEAESRLEDRRSAHTADGSAGTAGTQRPAARQPAKKSSNTTERVAIRAVGRRIRVIGDATVGSVTVDGTHSLRRREQVIEITSEGDVGPSMQGFSLFRPPRSFDDVKSMGLGKELTIRINPALQLDAEITGGSLHTEGVERLGKVRVTVGGARFIGVATADDVLVQAGPATLSGTIDRGRSRVRCESGTLTVTLGPDSNVTVYTESQLGRVGWAGGHTGTADEVQLGNGSARLDVGVVMGTATIRTEVGPDV